MKHLCHDEWLDAAKALHVGESRRIYHGAETRPNLVVHNKPAAWSAWCFHCNAGGYVRKQAAVVQEVQSSSSDSIEHGLHLQPISACSQQIQRDLCTFLQSKGCSVALLDRYIAGWDAVRNRLVLDVAGCKLGRAIYASPMKWFCYKRSQVLLQDCIGSNYIVLVEDVLSAIKLNKVLGVAVLALTGTRLQAHDLLALQDKRVLLHLDADAAGIKGRLRIQKQLQLLQIPYKVISTSKDPKELRHRELQALYGFIYSEVTS